MAKRTKRAVITGVTMEQVNQAFCDYQRAVIEIQSVEAWDERLIAKVRETSAEDKLKWENIKDEATAILESFALENRERLFSKKKSMETPQGFFGFRLGNPKLKPLKGYKWDDILDLVRNLMPEYIRRSEEVAKDRILADRDRADVVKLLPDAGISVVQEEVFFVDLK
jgi:phage host-nuclease inhibitor protein Gam